MFICVDNGIVLWHNTACSRIVAYKIEASKNILKNIKKGVDKRF